MQTVSHSQIQELVKRLPAAKLPIAYNFLLALVTNQMDMESLQFEFMLLPLSERRRIMTQQAEQMVAHYAQTTSERLEWQAGDFVEY
jgi:hypothetical protein